MFLLALHGLYQEGRATNRKIPYRKISSSCKTDIVKVLFGTVDYCNTGAGTPANDTRQNHKLSSPRGFEHMSGTAGEDLVNTLTFLYFRQTSLAVWEIQVVPLT